MHSLSGWKRFLRLFSLAAAIGLSVQLTACLTKPTSRKALGGISQLSVPLTSGDIGGSGPGGILGGSSDDVIYVELGVEDFDPNPTPSSNPVLTVEYPTGTAPVGVETYIFVRAPAFDCGSACDPLDYPDIFDHFTFGDTIDDLYNFSFTVTPSMIGHSASFFFVSVLDLGETEIIGRSMIHHVYPSSDPIVNEVNNPIMFVSAFPKHQVYYGFGDPDPNDAFHSPFGAMGHGYHEGVDRGNSLYLIDTDGNTRDLLLEAGMGIASGLQEGDNAIAVKDPTIHWNGQEAMVSILKGYDDGNGGPAKWKLYRVSNFLEGTPNVELIADQPDANNYSPAYGSRSNEIFFFSDYGDPATGGLPDHLYPPFDEYEFEPTNYGHYKLNTNNGNVTVLDHSPSGSREGFVDSFGRFLFIRWDHLERMQDGTASDTKHRAHPNEYTVGLGNTVSYNDPYVAIFPEKSSVSAWDDDELYWGGNWSGSNFFHHALMPWESKQDGTGLETLAHIGRHQMSGYIVISNSGLLVQGLQSHSPSLIPSSITTGIDHINRMYEDPNNPGTYYASDTDSDEFFWWWMSGKIVRMISPPGTKADNISIDAMTDNDNGGSYRDPLMLYNGTLAASYSSQTLDDGAQFHFYLYTLKQQGNYMVADERLNADPIFKTVSQPGGESFSGQMWEIQAQEVISRPVPPYTSEELPSIEATVFAQENVDLLEFKQWMADRKLALVVSRDVTTRDTIDRQQAFNLRVAGTNHQTIGSTSGPVHPVDGIQFFRGELRVEIDDIDYEGRGILATPDRFPASVAANPSHPIEGATQIYPDGSMAYFLEAGKAYSYQLISQDPAYADLNLGYGPIVRERYWVTFQEGEVRVCASCHGIDSEDQAGNPPPTNQPQALRAILDHWKDELQ